MGPANPDFSEFAWEVMRQLPLLLALFIGFFAGLFTWRRHPLVSGLVVMGTLLLFLEQAFFLYWDFTSMGEVDLGAAMSEMLGSVIHFGVPCVQALGLAMIVTAVFIGRRDARAGRDFDD